MTFRFIASLLLSITFVTTLYAAEDKMELKTNKDKMNYLAGVQMGIILKNDGIEPDYDIIIEAMKEALDDKPLRFSQKEIQQIVSDYKAEKILGDNVWKIHLKKPKMMTFDKNKDYFWILETNKGLIKLKLMPDVAPMHVTSTIYLTNKGFYDGLTFHRVIPGFMAQGGDPLGTGGGGPGYKYDSEFNKKVKHDKPYMLSMANTGQPGTDGSQFFITFVPTPGLDGKHTIFGSVTEGYDVVKKLEEAGSSPSGKTKEPLIINKARIEEKSKK